MSAVVLVGRAGFAAVAAAVVAPVVSKVVAVVVAAAAEGARVAVGSAGNQSRRLEAVARASLSPAAAQVADL